MEPYRQTIQNLNPKNSSLRFFAIGILYLVYGIFITISKENLHIWNSILWMISGTGFIIGAILLRKKGKEIYIEFNDNCIRENHTIRSSLDIRWEDIDKIEIKPISIKISLKSNDIKEISMGSYLYGQVIDIKAKLKEFAVEKDIKLT